MSETNINISDPTYRQISRYRAKQRTAAGGDNLTLPTGIQIDPKEAFGKRDYRGIRPPGADRAFIMHSPEKYIRDPKPGHRYIWRARQDEVTYGLVEAHLIRPVSVDRIRREVKGTQRIFQYAGAPDKEGNPGYYAGSGTMALFEAVPSFVDENYIQPQDYDLARLVSMQSKGEDNPIRADIIEAGERAGVKVEAVEVERTDVRTAAQEASHPVVK
jgi:hypothetical protein